MALTSTVPGRLLNRKIWILAFVLVVTAALGAVAIAAGGSAVTLVPEKAVGPVRLATKRADVEARLGDGAGDESVRAYRFRGVKLVVGYTTENRVREVRGSGGTLIAYDHRLSNEQDATRRLTNHGWRIEQCGPDRHAVRIRNGRFSGVVWHDHKLFQAGVSAVGAIGICPVGLPVER
jgi:hypothetical protein